MNEKTLKMKKPVLEFKTIILSDIHLGTKHSQAKKVNNFLKHSRAEKIILNGDIIDGWSLKRQGGWNKEHTRFIRLILKRIEKSDTQVIYLRGNHDDILERFLPLQFGSLQVVDEYVHETDSGSYLVVHGDIFDSVTQSIKWLAVLGDVGYQLLMSLNRFYNRYRALRGKEYYSLSKVIKAKVKHAVSYISDFEEQVVKLAEHRKCVGVMCGHIHTPADKQIGSVHYLNSGDWVESNTALVEHFDGRFEILEYNEFKRRLGENHQNEEPELESEENGVQEVTLRLLARTL